MTEVDNSGLQEPRNRQESPESSFTPLSSRMTRIVSLRRLRQEWQVSTALRRCSGRFLEDGNLDQQ